MRRKSMVVGLLVGALVLLVALGLGLKGGVFRGAPPPDYWPGEKWRTSTPEEQGVDSTVLLRAFDHIEKTELNIRSLLVVRNGYLVTEAYFHPYTPGQQQQVHSVTKSVIGALTGVAVRQGYLRGADERLCDCLPRAATVGGDARKRSLRLEHLLSLTAGFDYDDVSASPGTTMEESPNWVDFMLSRPVVEEPGSRFRYDGGAAHLVSAILQERTGKSAREFANEQLFRPLGIDPVPPAGWPSDPQGVSIGGYGLSLTARDMARLGYLYLRDGVWQGRRLLPAGWVKESTRVHVTKDDGYGYGYLWSVDARQGSYEALGLGGQQIHVLPAKDLVVVLTAAVNPGNNRDFVPLKKLFDEYLVPAAVSESPLPANPQAQEALRARVQGLLDPVRPVPPLPARALEVSGKTFRLEQNPVGWKTLRFDFSAESGVAQLTIDGNPVLPAIGLDNRYRLWSPGKDQPLAGLRACWEGPETLRVEQVSLGELPESDSLVRFQGDDQLVATIRDRVFGGEQTLRGRVEAN